MTNPELITQINLSHKTTSVIGNGSNADAIRYTKVTGLLVGDLTPSDHLDKGQEIINFARNAQLGKHGPLSSYELSLLEEIGKDTRDALNGL